MRSTRPERRPSRCPKRGGVNSTSTSSPCIAPPISPGGINTSSSIFGSRARLLLASAEQIRTHRDADRACPPPDPRCESQAGDSPLCAHVPGPRRSGPSSVFGNRPVFAIDLHQPPRAGEPPQLLAQLAPLLAAAQSQFADQLLIPGAPARQPFEYGAASRGRPLPRHPSSRHVFGSMVLDHQPLATDHRRPAALLTSPQAPGFCESAAALPANRPPSPSGPSRSPHAGAPRGRPHR